MMRNGFDNTGFIDFVPSEQPTAKPGKAVGEMLEVVDGIGSIVANNGSRSHGKPRKLISYAQVIHQSVLL